MTTALAFGSFDILHKGHESYLADAKKLADKLVVVVARDASIEKIKNIKPHHNEEFRRETVENLPVVDKAVLGDPNDFFAVFDEFKPDVVALGYDQRTFSTEKIQAELNKRKIQAKIVRLQSFQPETYKSSKLKEKL